MIGKKIASACAVMALLFVAAVPASADGTKESNSKSHRVEMIPVDLFYGDFDEGLSLFVGLTPEDFCNEVAPPMISARVFERSDGTLKVRAHRTPGIDLFLYKFDGGAPDLIDLTCTAMFDDDPATEPLQPLAVGKGWVKINLAGLDSLDDYTGIHSANSASGIVTSEDGTRWRVRSQANLNIDEDGYPVGDPAEFQGLRVRRIGTGW